MSMGLHQTVFPWSLVDEVHQRIADRGIEVCRYADLDYGSSRLGSRYRYLDEYIRFRYGAVRWLRAPVAIARLLLLRADIDTPLYRCFVGRLTRKGHPPVLILQHDADDVPAKTVQMMAREAAAGLVSSNYFFRVHPGDPTYQVGVEELQEWERRGFEIGYHLNVFERSEYDLDRAISMLKEDVAFFREHFNLRSYVPHGGEPSPDGRLNNEHFPHIGPLRNLLWAYNGRCILKERTWSDGAIMRRAPEDPREFVRRLPRGSRGMMLMHPQYYGDRLRDDWRALPISGARWWREIWGMDQAPPGG